MITYRLLKGGIAKEVYGAICKNADGTETSFIFDPANTDYANFKREINEGTAQLEDADGNLMTAEQAKDFVKELP